MAEAINRFAFNLYGKLKDQPGNLFCSPESISIALAMTYTGARGKTAEEMAAALAFAPDRISDTDWVCKACIAHLASINAKDGNQSYDLTVANALWAQAGGGFMPEFIEPLRKDFHADFSEVDFIKDSTSAGQRINQWVEMKTRNKIKDLISPGVLDSLTRLVLTNAVYFKGFWVGSFDKAQTQDEMFYLEGHRTVATPMMWQEERFNYYSGKGLQAIELPYKGNALSMLILLPAARNGLATAEKMLSVEKLADLLPKLENKKVNVILAKFKTTSQFDLNKTLSAMGMPLAFSQSADFSGMNGGKEPLHINAAIHRAYVDVNEEGTEAAAATGLAPMAMEEALPPVPVFKTDHPFLFLIRDMRSGCILFIGRIANPSL
ncbi:MAG: serpin family protein [Candidatus Sumerlaeota bacterium]|nr:serpin family protein [Candidatus Sumerlaeota bacterium]